MAAVPNFLFASLLIIICSLIESSYGAEKERLFSDLPNTLVVTAQPSRQGQVLDAGVDKITVTWTLNKSAPAGSDAAFMTISVKLCYAPISQVDRPWRKTENELFKDKTCHKKIVARPYDKTNVESLDWTIERDVPAGTFFVRAYALDAKGHEVAYGQNTDKAKGTNLFSIKAITGRHASLDIASICFSVFSVVALFVFFVNEKRKAKLEQTK